MITRVKWPESMRPGDEVFVGNALDVNTNGKTIYIRFLFSRDVSILSRHGIGNNTLRVKSKTKESIDLKYCASPDLPVPSKKDIAFVVYRRAWIKWRVLVGAVVVLVAMLPVIASAFRRSLMSADLSISGSIVVSVPMGILIASVLAWKRLIPVIKALLIDDVREPKALEAKGTSIGAIRFSEAIKGNKIAEWVPE